MGAQATEGSTEGYESTEEFKLIQGAIDSDQVDWEILRFVGSLDLTNDPRLRIVFNRTYTAALNAFKRANANAEVALFPPIGGVYATEDGDFNWTFDGETQIRFDWTDAAPMMNEIEELAEEAKEWWPPDRTPPGSSSGGNTRGPITRLADAIRIESLPARRQPHVMRAYSLATWVLYTIRCENQRHSPPDSKEEPSAPHDSFKLGIAKQRTELADAQRRFRDAAQRTAQSRYWRGAVLGALGVTVLSVILGGIFMWRGTSAAYGVAIPAGALGAMVSLLQRMSSGKLVLDIDAGRDLLEVLGAVRPFIGSIFGLIVAALILGGAVPAIEVPEGRELAFFAGVGFLAGFNERWAQDMLKSSGSQLGASGPPPAADGADFEVAAKGSSGRSPLPLGRQADVSANVVGVVDDDK